MCVLVQIGNLHSYCNCFAPKFANAFFFLVDANRLTDDLERSSIHSIIKEILSVVKKVLFPFHLNDDFILCAEPTPCYTHRCSYLPWLLRISHKPWFAEYKKLRFVHTHGCITGNPSTLTLASLFSSLAETSQTDQGDDFPSSPADTKRSLWLGQCMGWVSIRSCKRHWRRYSTGYTCLFFFFWFSFFCLC